MIRATFHCPGVIETTIEANPEDITSDKAAVLKELGFDRISLGVQSFNDSYLKFLGRNHDKEQAEKAFSLLRAKGFDNINVDMMCSFPQQTFEELKKDLRKLTRLQCEHVSLYTLTVEEFSRFYVKGLKNKNDSEEAKRYEYAVKTLEDEGWQQYEISNFAHKDKESKHNLNYWLGGNYIGLGVGAHSHVEGKRSWNVSRLKEYLLALQHSTTPQAGSEVLTPLQRLKESLVFGLRMNQGVHIPSLEKQSHCALPLECIQKIREFSKAEYLCYDGDYLKTTMKGRLVLDEISAYLI